MATEDRRITKTRKAIAAAFSQLLKERNFRDISVNDVAIAAEISRTTFYHHYTDKYDWLEQTIREQLRSYISKYHITDLQDRKTVLRRLTELFQNISSNPQLCNLIQVNENSQLMYMIFRESLLEQYHALYGPTARLSPQEDLAVHYVAASTSAYIEWWVRNNTLFTPEQFAHCIDSFHHSGSDKT